MDNMLSNTYYVKALESYPYDLTETLEALGYALSYNPEHAGAHCLLGRLYMEQLKQYDKAADHYEQALVCDIDYILTYECYSMLCIYTKQYGKALDLISYAIGISGANEAILKHRESLIYENQGNLKAARKLMKEACNASCNEDERPYLKKELERIKDKLGASGRKSSKKSKKKPKKKSLKK
ncbi:MAG: hypothetical protein ABFS28_04240 [Bacteroidota bacterium]